MSRKPGVSRRPKVPPPKEITKPEPAFGAGPLGPTDWYYRNLVPKDPDENLAFRKWLLDACYADPALQEEVRIICARDILFYISAFGWILEPREKPAWSPSRIFGNAKELPLLLRDYQEEMLLEIQSVLGQKDILIQKSREMGASWMMLYLVDHEWRFKDQVHIGLVSKDEDSATSIRNPDSLFAKLAFIDDHMPLFLRPRRETNIAEGIVKNLETGSTYSGYASGPDVGRGGRKKFFIMDEMHFFPAGSDYAVQDSLQHITHCRILISTVNRERGQGGQFYDAVMNETADVKRITLSWKDDKEKAAGLYTSANGDLEILDKDYVYPANYQFVLDGKVRSPYYDYECRRVGATDQSIAAELDMDFGGAATRFFDSQVIREALQKVQTPLLKGLFRYQDDRYLPEFEASDNGEIELWIIPERNADDELVVPADRQYSLGIDISAGTGGASSSYSAMVAFDRHSGEQVLQWRSNTVRPHDLAKLSVVVGKWLNNAVIVPESNGTVGQWFIDQFMKLNYPYPYIRTNQRDNLAQKSSNRVGIHNSDGGETILGEMQAAMKERRCILRSLLTVRECERYYRDKNGKLVHPLVGKGRENAPARSHGDAAIAAAAAWYAIRDKQSKEVAIEEQVIPKDSWLASRQRFLAEQARKLSYWSPFTKKRLPQYTDE